VADFLLDHDVHPELGVMLKGLGHRATRAYDLGFAAAEDAEILLTAARSGHILVTCNQGHFTALHYAWLLWPTAWRVAGQQHAGILGLPQLRRRDCGQWAAAIDHLVMSRQARLTNELHLWDAGRWVQQP
jgi:hypothetical protein